MILDHEACISDAGFFRVGRTDEWTDKAILGAGRRVRLVTQELVLSGSAKVALLLLDQVLLLDRVAAAAVCCCFPRGARLLPTMQFARKGYFEVCPPAEHN